MKALVGTLVGLAVLGALNVSFIDSRVIPHLSQRYETAGDWWWTGPTLHLRVSNLGSLRYHVLVGAHEGVEAILCRLVGIHEAAVSGFDIAHADLDEPGDAPRAPYHWAHRAASVAERALAVFLLVDWTEYNAAVDALPEWKELNR